MVQKSDTNPSRLREVLETRPRLKVKSSHVTGSTKYKKEIQFAIAENYCQKGFDEKYFIRSGTPLTAALLNRSINELKKCAEFIDIYRYPQPGIGPGELMLYFLIDDAYLAGGSEGGDVRIGNDVYEVKSAIVKQDGVIEGFKLGGTVQTSEIQKGLLEIKNRVKKYPSNVKMNEPGGVNRGHYDVMLKEFPNEMKALEKKFQDAAYGYFSQHNILILDNSSTASRTGLCKYLGNVRRENINIGVLTSGTIKPQLSGLRLV